MAFPHLISEEYVEQGERVDGDRDDDEEDVEGGERHEELVEGVLPHLARGGEHADGDEVGHQAHHAERGEEDAFTPPLYLGPDVLVVLQGRKSRKAAG